jgi:hypothetical protein
VTIVGARADGHDGVRWPFGLWDSLSMVVGGLVLVRVGSDLRLFLSALTLWLP